MATWFWKLLVGLVLLGASGAQGQQGAGSFGARPIYLRGSAFSWQFTFDEPIGKVFDAAVKSGKKHQLRVAARDDGAGVLHLARANEKGATLDKLCTYPVVNYYGWQPVEDYATAQRDAISRRRSGNRLGRVSRLNGTVYVTVRSSREGVFDVQSICSAYLRDWGVVEATSSGVLEKGFLETFLKEVGTPGEVPIPVVPSLEPSREDPTRDFHVVRRCRERCTPATQCPGLYVDPETRELACVGGLDLDAAQGQ